MKKTYITPEIFSIILDPKLPYLQLNVISAEGDEGQFTKEHVSGDDTAIGSGSKNIWDDEW